MEMQFRTLNHELRVIKLSGRFDIAGTREIETGLAGYCSGEDVRVIVDLSEVDFLASTGIRLLVSNAKSITKRGGKMVILHPSPAVRHTLEAAGIPGIIPIYTALESAETVLTAPQE